MNERQRDLFLYVWSKRREPGQTQVALRGAGIGALGGLVFAMILGGGGGANLSSEGQQSFGAIASIIGAGGVLLLLSVGAFGLLGFFLANRVFASQEAMYQSLLATGAQPPAQKPVMQGADRWPAIAVGIAVVVIVSFIAFVWITLG